MFLKQDTGGHKLLLYILIVTILVLLLLFVQYDLNYNRPGWGSTQVIFIEKQNDRNKIYYPHKFDWRNNGSVIGPVSNQKKCNGCWAFSIVGVMEAMARIQGISQESLSIQQLIDCSNYTNGCINGSVLFALAFLKNYNLSITTEQQYPLTLKTERCLLWGMEGVRVKTFFSSDGCMPEDWMAEKLASHGPLVVTINQEPLYYYVGGIVQRSCPRPEEEALVHVVQIVGYDTTGEVPYYIVKNSWGEDFGEQGYVRIAMFGNVCGIADDVAFLDVD